jgi:hypothetical protein
MELKRYSMMQTSADQRSTQNFQFRFVSVLAKDVDSGEAESSAAGLAALNALGADGWEIRSVSVDPRLPAARLLIALQRQAR